MKTLMGLFLKFYLWAHERLHERILHSIAIRYFDGLHPKNIFHYRSEFFLSNLSPGDRVIDVACGTGRILSAIAPSIEKGLGLDLSDQNLIECQRLHEKKNLEFKKSDVLKENYSLLRTQFPYNKAIFSHILEHIEDVPALLRAVAAEEVLICVPSQENWHRQTLKHLGLRYTTDPTHFREYTRPMLLEELNSAGYAVLEMNFNSEGEIVCRAKYS
jgi:SAM-dependent methyltransferase